MKNKTTPPADAPAFMPARLGGAPYPMPTI